MVAESRRVEIVSADSVGAAPGRVDTLLSAAADRAEVLAALAWEVWHGARSVRTDDIAAATRICRTVEAVLDARQGE
jgi:hypothetical protein